VSRTYGTSNSVNVLTSQKSWDRTGRARLQQLLSSSERIAFPHFEQPGVSLILVFLNKAHLSILGLESILANADASYEVVIVDNGSTDDTCRLLERIDGANIVRNSANVGFAKACTQGAKQARGEHLCFLNNDVLLQPSALGTATSNFRDSGVGAVGGKILLANGDLQEAGSVIWADGPAVVSASCGFLLRRLLAHTAKPVPGTGGIQLVILSRLLRRRGLLHEGVEAWAERHL